MTTAAIMLVALCLDALIGWPNFLYKRIGHPVVWIGKLISRLDKDLNRADWHPPTRRLMGILTALFVILACASVGRFVQVTVGDGALGFVLSVLVAWPLIAVHSLYNHVRDVAEPLSQGSLPEAQTAVSMIVGRDPSFLDTSGVGRAAIESLSENASDGVVAPVFWGVVFGLPGLMAYKAINTLDSMIGYKTPKHIDFGWASARIDDVANWIPARLTGGLIALASGKPERAIAVIRQDARKHRSPNAGWPEGAMAGALDVRLSGPRVYHDGISSDPWLNSEARDVDAHDVNTALDVFQRAMLAFAGLLVLLALI